MPPKPMTNKERAARDPTWRDFQRSFGERINASNCLLSHSDSDDGEFEDGVVDEKLFVETLVQDLAG